MASPVLTEQGCGCSRIQLPASPPSLPPSYLARMRLRMRRAHVSRCLEIGLGLPEKAISRLSGAADEKRQAGDRWHQLPRHITPTSRSPAAESPSPSPKFRCLSPDVKCPLLLITRHGTVWVLPQWHHFSKEPAVSPMARAASRSVRRGSVRLCTHRARCRGRRGSRERLRHTRRSFPPPPSSKM